MGFSHSEADFSAEALPKSKPPTFCGSIMNHQLIAGLFCSEDFAFCQRQPPRANPSPRKRGHYNEGPAGMWSGILKPAQARTLQKRGVRARAGFQRCRPSAKTIRPA